MKIEKDWLESADKALKRFIVNNNEYNSIYKGYISSFGASIVQSGLIAASAFFEKKDADSEGERYLIVKAVICILCDQKILSQSFVSLAEYALRVNQDIEKLLNGIDKAIASLKIAIRQYTAVKTKKSKIIDEELKESANDHIVLSEEEFNQKYICNLDNYNSNIGWLYYRDYYRNFTCRPTDILVTVDTKELKRGTNLELLYKKQNEYICRSSFNTLGTYNKGLIKAMSANTTLYFKTSYPGLLIGAGLSHGTGADYDMKVGFLFDYTTGLPYIPGSSIKGVLRSMFPHIKSKDKLDEKDEIYNVRRIKYIQSIIGDIYSKEQIIMLTEDIFETPAYEEGKNRRKRDIFMDALIVETGNDHSYIVGDDFITPHKNNPLKNPQPLQFLKVLPNVTFCFTFNLFDSIIDNKMTFSKTQKEKLFKVILSDIGVGAKTNVGYGQLMQAELSKNICEDCNIS